MESMDQFVRIGRDILNLNLIRRINLGENVVTIEFSERHTCTFRYSEGEEVREVLLSKVRVFPTTET